MSLRQRGVIEIQIGAAGHADPFHHPARGVVVSRGESHDLIKVHRSKAVIEPRPRGLGGEHADDEVLDGAGDAAAAGRARQRMARLQA